ncbi:MAG: Holliday junction branch migration protein RuvA [Erysipelotrichaceae bacterium]|nr:Holliday junction branch migration protein RuvA [Erysipelotrichaceae bacterium]
MIAFIKGKVYSLGNDYIIIENQGIGYYVYVANTQNFSIQMETIIYTYQHVREDAISLFGFRSMEEHDLFMRLIGVKGVGPKTALSMLGVCSAKEMITAIETNDVNQLKKLPGIGAKTAQQIVLDLKGKLVEVPQEDSKEENDDLKDALEALKALGYKQVDIQSIKKELISHQGKTVDEYIRLALSILAKRKGV